MCRSKSFGVSKNRLLDLYPPETVEQLPPRLRLGLLQLWDALTSDEVHKARRHLWTVLDHMIRFFAGLACEALEYEGQGIPSRIRALRASAGSLEGAEMVLGTALGSLPTQPRTRRTQLLRQIFFPAGEVTRGFSRWLRLVPEETPLPRLSQWQPTIVHDDLQFEALRQFMPLLIEWLEASHTLFQEESFSLLREVEITLPDQAPVETPAQLEPIDPVQASRQELDDQVAYWDQRVLSPRPEDGSAGSLQQLMRAHCRRGQNALGRHMFSLAEQDFNQVIGFHHAVHGFESLQEWLGHAFAGRGRVRSCLGRWEEAEADLVEAEKLWLELVSAHPTREHGVSLAQTLLFRGYVLARRGDEAHAREKLERAAQLAKDAPELKAAALNEQSLSGDQAALKACVEVLRGLCKAHPDSPHELELACALVEWAYRLDPAFRNPRAASSRREALEAVHRVRKREPSLQDGGELLTFLLERRERWGRPGDDPRRIERDLRAARLLFELSGQELGPLLDRAEALPQDELFGLFADAYRRQPREAGRGAQAQIWLRLAWSFQQREEMSGYIRCMALACCALSTTRDLEEGRQLLSALDNLAEAFVSGQPSVPELDLVGQAFHGLVELRQRFWPQQSLKKAIEATAARWQKLPVTVPARAGISRPLLSQLAQPS